MARQKAGWGRRIVRVFTFFAAMAALGRVLGSGTPAPGAAPPRAGAPPTPPDDVPVPPAAPGLIASVQPAPPAPPAPPRGRSNRRAWRVAVPVVVAVALIAGGAVAFVGDGSDEAPVPPPTPAAREALPQANRSIPPAGPEGPLPLGVYIDPGDREGFEEFAAWLGRRPLLVSDGLEEQRWEAIVDPWWLIDAWRDVDAQIVYSLVMIPRAEGGTLQQGAAGEYDVHFRELAERLVEGGQGDAVLRPGWEFSGDWQPWSARSDPTAWKQYYRRIVDTMRAVPGSEFTFVWNPALGPIDPDNWPAERAWPGREWVDVIGVDPYDICFIPDTYPIPDDATPADTLRRQQLCWADLRHGDHGLEWYADFAERHRRPLSIPEFALVPRDHGGGGDNPVFIQGMADFARDHGLAWLVYFNKEEAELGRHSIDDDTYPESSALFRSQYGPDPPAAGAAGSGG